MSRQYLAFDLEIAKNLPEGPIDLKSHRPLGIACAAILYPEQGETPTLWYSLASDDNPASQMNQFDLRTLVNYLSSMVNAGYTILTWNGLNFDFDILAEESGLSDQCKALAWQHVDMMFDFFCRKGFWVGLNSSAKGLGLPGKTEGMSGEMAPRLWAEGKHQSVLDYAGQDVVTTMQVAIAAEKLGELRWVTRKGTGAVQELNGGWLTAIAANALPLPVVDWMDDPVPRTHLTDWLGLSHDAIGKPDLIAPVKEVTMAYCPEGHYLEQDDKFCGRCGQAPVTECRNGRPYKR